MPDYCIAEKTVDPKSNVTVKIYDGLGRIKYVIDGDYVPGTPVTSYMTYNYYDTGNLQSVVYPNNYKEEYFYKKDNRLEKLINWKYDGKNLVKMDEYVYIYDGADNIDTKKEKINGSTTEIVTSYQYDSLNRLTNVNEQSKNRVTVYTFDPAGNRDTETITIIKGSNEEKTYRKYNYDLQNRLDYTVLRKTDANGAILEEVDYQTDKNGNVIKITVSSTTGNSITENTYDVLNRLTKTSIDGVVVTENIYNAEGLRIVKKSEGATTRYFYEYDKIVLEISTDTWGNVEQAQNIYGTNLLKRKVGTDAVYYMYNGHGDVTALIDASFGYLRGMYYYDAFGNQSTELIYGDVDGNGRFDSDDYSYMRQFLIGMITEFPASTGAIAADVDGNGKINTDDYAYAQQILIGMIRYFPADKNEDNLINDSSMFGYAGYFYDAETGLYYLNSRMYDPTTARFLQEDTYTGEIDDPLSLNLYTYCHNEPLMYWDPTGRNYVYINGQGYTVNELANGEHWLEEMGVKRSEAPYIKEQIVEGIRYAASNPNILAKAGNKVSSFFNANIRDRYLSPIYYVPVEEYIDSELLQNSDPYYIDQINPYTGKSFRQGFFDYKMQTDKAFAEKISAEMDTDWFMEGVRYGILKSTIGIVDMPYELRQAGRQSVTYGGIGVQLDAIDKPVITHKVPQYGPNINKFNSGKANGIIVGTSFTWATSELVTPYVVTKVASLLGKIGAKFPVQISMLESEIEFMANGSKVAKTGVGNSSNLPAVIDRRAAAMQKIQKSAIGEGSGQ